jgi:DNA-directed RNA polymerase subunit M/transcription elongation factor TFIIS
MPGSSRIEDVDPNKFWAKVPRGGDGCWLWQGAMKSTGYGQFGRSHAAHRVAFVLAGGVIPEGYEVDHLCNTPRCVRPEHLEAVTPEENQRRRLAAGLGGQAMFAERTECPKGHPYDEQNTMIEKVSSTGGQRRHCRTCLYESTTKRREAARRIYEETGSPPAIQPRKTHCVNGHLMDEENTYVFPDGRRSCRSCRREHHRRYRQRKAS